MIRFGRFRLDPRQGLARGSQNIHLTPKSLAILSLLAERPGRIVSKQELFDCIWPDTAVSDAALTSCIQELRQALGDNPRAPRYIETVHRRGFRFVARVANPEDLQHASDALATDSQLVGRDSVLAEMRRALLAAIAGSRQILFLSGEPGIGKTAVLSTFLAGEKSRPRIRVTGAVCVEHYGAAEAYRPLLEALTRLCRGPDGASVVATLAQCAPAWLAQLPAVQSPAQFAALQRRIAGATRDRMLRELTDAVETITVEAPLVFWLEDLHWADPSTLDWIAAFATRREPARILILGSFRPMESGSAGQLVPRIVDDLRLKGLCRDIAVTGLDAPACDAYVRSRHPPAPGAEASLRRLSSQLCTHTGGNPLFAANVLADLVANGVLVEQHGGWSTRSDVDQVILGVPDDVRRVIERQLERIERDTLDFLQVASVVGLEGSAAAIAAGAGRGPDDVEAALGWLARQSQFVAEAGIEEWPDGTVATRFRFRHSLYREVLRGRLPAARRADVHARVGLRLETGYGDRAGEIAPTLAVHFEEGRDVRRALVHLQHAARTAVRRSALQEAGRSFGRALRLLETLPVSHERHEQEIALRVGMGAVLMASKGWGAAEVEAMYARARELCEELGNTPQLFPALWGLWLFYWGRGSLETAHPMAEHLLALARRVGDRALLLQAHHALWATTFSVGDLQGAHEHAAAGIGLYVQEDHFPHVTSYGNHDAAVCALNFDARALALLGQTAAALRSIDRGVALARRLGHPFTLALALVFGAAVHQIRRDVAMVARYAGEAVSLCREQSFTLVLAWNLTFSGWAEVHTGSAADGARTIAEGIARTRATGSDQFLSHLLAVAADAHLRTGAAEQGLTCVEDALALAGRTGERFYEAELHRLHGELQLARDPGSTVEASAAFQRAIDLARSQNAKLLTLRACVSIGRVRRRHGTFDDVRAMLQDALAEVEGDESLLDVREAEELLRSD